MDKKITINRYYLFLLFLIFLPLKSLYGQAITITELNFTSACAGLPDSFNQGKPFNYFDVPFTLSGTFPPSTTFEVVLSDDKGSFTNPIFGIAPSVTLAGSTTTTNGQQFLSINAVKKVIRFGLPSNPTAPNPALPGGDKYRIRVRSIQDNSIYDTTSSTGFSAAYMIFNDAFRINQGALSTAICGSGNSLTLSVDPDTPLLPSPSRYPSLKYKWYNGNTLLTQTTGPSITISTPGTYHAEIDYGSCDSKNTRSQDIIVSVVSTGQTFSITPATVDPVCVGTPVTLSTTPGYVYQWLNNGVPISGETNFQLVTTQPGNYTVSINAGPCSGASTNSVQVTTKDFGASLDDRSGNPVVYTLEKVKGNVKVTVTGVSGTGVGYQWFENTSSDINNPNYTIISGETSSSYTATKLGKYKVQVTGNTGSCLNATQDLFFVVKEGVSQIPNVISPNADTVNDTWMLPQEFLSDSIEVQIMNNRGDIVFKSNNYQNDWPQENISFQSVNPIYYYIITKEGQEVTKGSITVVK